MCPVVFACEFPIFPSPYVEKNVFSTLNRLDTLIKNYLTIDMRANFWILYCIPLVYMSFFMPLPHYSDLVPL